MSIWQPLYSQWMRGLLADAAGDGRSPPVWRAKNPATQPKRREERWRETGQALIHLMQYAVGNIDIMSLIGTLGGIYRDLHTRLGEPSLVERPTFPAPCAHVFVT